ncbi:hypothetical protein COX95_00540 [bacterium CG_4_10_14_0_2_um_filter_33_32]|nr:MAG: hypothetical protein AUJ93_04525 [bacterium CG2_30_33_46]PIR68000.1 MAG: hypothetical protein COU50_00305 [bacterium CG10_big_fil_rev_8_21_14_0_10_33_18]PIU76979.1 MAG: hypothetical protein COS74_01195 [bacterium CG06_land_8_20_14_3_00_33_50]PIW81443.1 MAG: hypothetical protein COZ97_01740 [bacterium CG_4_8_14_3_um_filter_33_28]PIY85360.1 MAG: hypothetical protein COY76_02555 [bacterium CG_4_10_14_0_8_um_filter_33_57]PIZ86615.1 MAG: hypothetical protein COX95_00540 [bacterium CG_4_10_1
MIIIWLIYTFALIVFFVIGWTGVYHVRKFSISGDLTQRAITLYVSIMIVIALVSIFFVLKNGASASFDINFGQIFDFKR